MSPANKIPLNQPQLLISAPPTWSASSGLSAPSCAVPGDATKRASYLLTSPDRYLPRTKSNSWQLSPERKQKPWAGFWMSDEPGWQIAEQTSERSYCRSRDFQLPASVLIRARQALPVAGGGGGLPGLHHCRDERRSSGSLGAHIAPCIH